MKEIKSNDGQQSPPSKPIGMKIIVLTPVLIAYLVAVMVVDSLLFNYDNQIIKHYARLDLDNIVTLSVIEGDELIIIAAKDDRAAIQMRTPKYRALSQIEHIKASIKYNLAGETVNTGLVIAALQNAEDIKWKPLIRYLNHLTVMATGNTYKTSMIILTVALLALTMYRFNLIEIDLTPRKLIESLIFIVIVVFGTMAPGLVNENNKSHLYTVITSPIPHPAVGTKND